MRSGSKAYAYTVWCDRSRRVEVRRRLEAFRKGEMDAVPANKVLEEARDRLSK